jgi:Flp pilus assembly pilin Flp
LSRLATRLLRDEGGQATVEYILILSAAIVGAGALSRKILQTIDKGVLRLGGQLEKDLKTGRAPVDIWNEN